MSAHQLAIARTIVIAIHLVKVMNLAKAISIATAIKVANIKTLANSKISRPATTITQSKSQPLWRWWLQNPTTSEVAKSSKKKTIARVLLDSGSDRDLLFHKKGASKHFPYLTRQVPKHGICRMGTSKLKERNLFNWTSFNTASANGKRYIWMLWNMMEWK